MNDLRKIMYPHALLKELTDNIDESLIQFFNIHQGEKYFYNSTLYETCIDIWMDVVNGKTDQSDLLKIRRNFLSQRKRKKKRWYDSTRLSVEQLSIDDKRHPFSFIIESKNVLSSDQWNMLYPNMSMKDVINQKIEEMRIWSEDDDALMIHCPALNSFTSKKIFDAFSSDITIQMFDAADLKFHLRLNEFTEAYIDEMGRAYFTPDGRKKYERPAEGALEKEIPLSETGDDKLFLSISQEAFGSDTALTTSMFDEKDQRLLMYITRQAADSAVSTKIAIPAHALAKAMLGKRNNNNISSKNYMDMEKHLYKIAGTTFTRFEKGRQIAAINFLGSVTKVVRNGQSQFDITLGPIISDAIIGDQIRRLPSSTFEQIDSSVGRLLILGLQRERIKAFGRYRNGTSDEMVTQFSYSNFLAMVNFSTNNKTKNWRAIREALAEFQQKKIFIDRVLYDNVSRIALIYWKALTEDEQKDLSLFGYRAIMNDTEDENIN